MRIGVLGTGQVGSGIARKLHALGHDVMLGSRDPQSARTRELAASLGVEAGTHAEAAEHGEWIVCAMPGEAVVEVLRRCDLGDKILIDISNYDSAVDQPITVPLGVAIQQAFPSVRVVKALNSVSAHLMVDPGDLGETHSVFVAGNDAGAKAEVTALLKSFGWSDVIDLGDISEARAMEQLIPLWMALERVSKGPEFNLRVVRPNK